jgi:hypothetical protein
MIGDNAWDNGSWVRTPSDISNIFWGNEEYRCYQQQEEARRQKQEAMFRRRAEELKAAWRARVLAGPGRAVKRYQNAVRKIGLMAVSEALGLG